MLAQIKKMAQKGQTTGAKMLAKDIVRSKNQQAKLEQFVGQLSAVSLRIGSCASLNELGDAMSNCAKAMTLVSSKLDAKKLAHMAKEIAKQYGEVFVVALGGAGTVVQLLLSIDD